MKNLFLSKNEEAGCFGDIGITKSTLFNVSRNCEAEGIGLQQVSGQAGLKNGIDHKQTTHLRMQGRVGVPLDQLSKKRRSTFQCEQKDETKKREAW